MKAPNVRRPDSLKEAGKVLRLSVTEIEVQWLSNRVERLALATIPLTLATFSPGQWFEADVWREPAITGALTRIGEPTPISPIEPMSPNELEEFWASIPPLGSRPG